MREPKMTFTSIKTEDAEDYVYGGHVAIQEVSQHRWYTKRLVVIDTVAGLAGFYYFEPATEDQEGQDLFEADPVPVFPVVAREITTTIYESEDSA
jgi:hypothetical protein